MEVGGRWRVSMDELMDKNLPYFVGGNLSASDHVRRVISDSAQSLYALRVLRHHGLGEAGLQTVFRAIVVCLG